MRKPVRVVVGIVAVLLLAAGCGGGSDESSTPPTTKDPRSAAEFASDKAEAERVVLRLTDLPPNAGFTGEPDTEADSPELDAAQDRFAACLGVDPSLIDGGAEGRATAESDNFSDEEGNQISNSVTVVATVQRAQEQLAALQKPQAPQCFQEFVDVAIKTKAAGPDSPPDLTFGAARTEPLDLPELNAEGVAYRAVVPITTQGQTVDLFLDAVLALKGRTGISMTFTGVQTPFLEDFETSLTNKVIDRAPAD